MNMRWNSVAGCFLIVALAILTSNGSALAAEKKKMPDVGQTPQGQTLSVPLGCSRETGTCSCLGDQDCGDLTALKACDGKMSCQGTQGTQNYSCSCKYKAPQ